MKKTQDTDQCPTHPLNQKMRIIWAVDPFAADNSLQRSAAWALRALTHGKSAEIEPVFLLSDVPREIPFDGSRWDLLEQVRLAGQEELNVMLRRIKIPGLLPIRILADTTGSLGGRVRRLIDFAKENSAELIVASTHARKGPHRWFTGSFVESLMLHSEVPLFLVNPSWDHAVSLKHILCPTDLSEESKTAFHQVVQFAAATQSKITLYNKMDFDMSPAISAVLSAYPPFLPISPESIQGEVKNRKNEAAEWVKGVETWGVPIEIVIDARMSGSVAEAILKVAKKKSGMIAMAARSGAWSAAILGSTTRQVLRFSESPVWVVHTQAEAAGTSALGLAPRKKKPARERDYSLTEIEVMKDLRGHRREG